MATAAPTQPTLIKTSELSQTTSTSTKALQATLSGSLAGILGKIIEYPFDTLKVRLQSQPSTIPPLYTGPLDCFRQGVARDGFLSLYRGISAPLFGAAVETSSLFFSYRIAQEVTRSMLYSDRGGGGAGSPTGAKKVDGDDANDFKLPLTPLIFCGAASGAFTSLFLTPIELVKCQMQVPLPSPPSPSLSPSSTRRTGVLAVIKAVVRYRGLLGFWHGHMGTFIRETGGSAAWFGSYEAVGALFRRYNHKMKTREGVSGESEKLHFHQQLLAGAAAGMNYNFVCFPADTIKSRMQTAEVSAPQKGAGGRKETFWENGRALWRQQGLRGMYRGCGITVARSAPSSAVIFAVEERLRGWWDERWCRRER